MNGVFVIFNKNRNFDFGGTSSSPVSNVSRYEYGKYNFGSSSNGGNEGCGWIIFLLLVIGILILFFS